MNGNAFQLPFHHQFDCVYSFRFIRHFEDLDRQRIYSEIRRVLRPGGVLVFDAVNRVVSGPLRDKNAAAYPIYDALLGPQEIRRELSESGFERCDLMGVQKRYSVLYQLQVLLAPRTPRLARFLMEVVDRFGGGRASRVDSDVSQRVTFWTGTWDPDCEAHSRQITSLKADSDPRALVVSISAGQKTFLDVRHRVFGFSQLTWPLLRLLAPGLERMGQISHLFGGLSSWHLLKATGRRPVVFTVTIDGSPLDPSLYRKVGIFVAEDDLMCDRLSYIGIPRSGSA